MAITTNAIDLSVLLDLYDHHVEAKTAVAHNVDILKCIRGGLRLAEEYRLSFDPRADYWRRPERRLVVAYLADRWTGRFAPARSLRQVALHMLRHFDLARTEGIVSYVGTDYDQAGGLTKLCTVLADHARRLSPTPAWSDLRAVWPKLAETPADDLASFLEEIPSSEAWERSFRRRFPWFGYLGTASLEELRRRQAFFFGYANLWTTTNAYVRAGAQAFAPVLQNTASDAMLAAVHKWAQGVSPMSTQFLTLGRDDNDDEPQDRSEYAPVVEVYGFLNLHRAPFYNNRAETYRKWFGIPESVNAYDLTASVGRVTAQWLAEHPIAVERLTEIFNETLNRRLATRVEVETIEDAKVRKRSNKEADPLLDSQLLLDLSQAAKTDLAGLGAQDIATLAFHLLLDSKLFLESVGQGGGVLALPHTPAPPVAVPVPPQIEPPSVDSRRLPDGLRPAAERALAYLKAGLHVLFAGAPGTGKTTLAQFVGHAWDRGSDSVPDSMPANGAPLTTVGNSAWSPFHTVGGLMQDKSGAFTSHAGIFIDPASAKTDLWRLHDGAIVLDEMNRADLDRCIGELYPLLSGSVDRVKPAGLPGVGTIIASPRFRVLATVNDATLDDIVFPISEGLARRFQRIELHGASRDDVLAYLGLDDAELKSDRQRVTLEAVEAFFAVARELNLLAPAEDDERLPFGVAYFALLRAWVDGRLEAPVREATTKEQARDLLAGSLRTLGRTKKWEEALRVFLKA